MLSNTQKMFLFALGMCLFCSFALTGAAVGLKERQDRNMLIDRQKNILKSLSLIESKKKYLPSEIESIYKESVQEYFVDTEGVLSKDETSLPIFVVSTDGKLQKYAVPFKAYGLWSWVKGYIALEGDGETVAGFTVYSHAETPGLGAECEKPWFQDQFVGKKITDINGEFVSVGVVKGKVSDFNYSDTQKLNYVDGMSGATITGKGIEVYLKDDLLAYEKFAEKLRRG